MCVTILLAAISLTALKSGLLAILGLGFVIFVHELGHFVVAKLCGVKCEKFYVGFDVPIKLGPLRLPSALFRKKFGETEYGVGVIPLGGYVKMLGQDDNPANAAKEAERIRKVRESGEADDNDPKSEIDPRSYPAKPVWKRMAIISAGVIMNLIFAVIFGAIAYRSGVSYTPCIVGSTIPGLSGWEVGLQPGDRILQVGRDGKQTDHLRFQHDMVVQVMMAGVGSTVELLVQRHGESAPVWIPVHLRSPNDEMKDRPYIGIGSIGINEIEVIPDPKFERIAAETESPPFESGDLIVAANGQPMRDHVELSRFLAREVDNDVTFTVERKTADSDAKHELEIRVSKNPLREIGAGMEMGPIVAIQKGSPAETAGLHVGDTLKSINGQSIQHGLIVPHLLRRLAGQTVQFEVERGAGTDAEKLMISAQLRAPTMNHPHPDELAGYISAESLGIAFAVTNRVVSVQQGSPADKAGIKLGDTITKVDFSYTPAEIQKLGIVARTLARFRERKVTFDLSEKNRLWPMVQYRMQLSLPETKMSVEFNHDGISKTVVITPVAADEWNSPERGLTFRPESAVHKVNSIGEAFSLGWRETKEGIAQVAFILRKLVTGQFSPKNLGGPITIVYAAGSEASEGFPRLLLFLTMLSANLAVLNFLPIPVLDGGHAVFLLYEGIFRKPPNERVAFGLTMTGLCLILGLMLFVFGLDLTRLSNWIQ